jgi:hypothetical protein
MDRDIVHGTNDAFKDMHEKSSYDTFKDKANDAHEKVVAKTNDAWESAKDRANEEHEKATDKVNDTKLSDAMRDAWQHAVRLATDAFKTD